MRSRFDENRVASGQSRCDFMSDKVQGKIERGDPEHGADRKPPKNAEMGICSGCPVERNDLARDTLGLLCSHREGLHGPIDFPPGVRDRLPRFSRNQTGKLLAAIVDRPGDPLQKVIPRMRGKGFHGHGRVGRRLDRRLGIGLVCLRDLGQNFSREGVVHRSHGLSLSPLAPDQKWTWSLHGDAPLVEEVLRCGLD